MPRTLRFVVLYVSSFLPAFSYAAIADDTPPNIGQTVQAASGDVCKYGKNGDGIIRTEQEATVFFLHQKFDIYRLADKTCDGKLTASEISRFELDAVSTVAPDVQSYKDWASVGRITVVKGGTPALVGQKAVTPSPQTGPAPSQGVSNTKSGNCGPGWAGGPIIRDSFTELSIFAACDPTSAAKATGAQFTYSDDLIAANRSFSANGVVAFPYSWIAEASPPDRTMSYVSGFNIAPVVSFQRLTESNPKLQSKQIDILSYGLYSDLAVERLFGDPYLTNHFRLRAAANGDFEGDVKSYSVTGEWEPLRAAADNVVGLGSPNQLGYLHWQVNTILRAQYYERPTTKPDPLFDTSNSIFRAGPVLAFSIGGNHGDPVPGWLQKTSFVSTFSTLTDFSDRREFNHWTNALVWNLDDAGNVAIKLKNEIGRIEDTGQKVNLTTLGLALKY